MLLFFFGFYIAAKEPSLTTPKQIA